MIGQKLLELLNNGEGHTIFKTESVIKALDESGIKLIPKIEAGKLRYYFVEGKPYILPVIQPPAPNHIPRSKYDIVSWDVDTKTGVHDLDLIQFVCLLFKGSSLLEKEVKEYNGRGKQYGAFYEWLDKKIGLTEKTAS